jgi:hypothetical protein
VVAAVTAKGCGHGHQFITEQTCEECGLEVDSYGNTSESLDYCCFPDCGCDGARLCMAPQGANMAAIAINIERGSLS